MLLFRKVITTLAIILSGALILDGVYKIIVMGSRNWGEIIIGAFFLIAVSSGVNDVFKPRG